MESELFVKRIKKYSIISLLLPLIVINSCFLLYKFLGNTDAYFGTKYWDRAYTELSVDENRTRIIKREASNFTNLTDCPKYIYNDYYKAKKNDGTFITSTADSIFTDYKASEITFVFEKTEILNQRCVKNNKFAYFLLSNFNSLEKILINSIENNATGFSVIKNPYLYGEVSISRTARYYPATLIFKPFIVLSAIFLFFYWKNNLNLFNNFKDKKILVNFSKTFFYLGSLSCLFLAMHAIFLGLDFDSKLFAKIRRLIIILFIFSELAAQIFLTKHLFKYKEEIKKYINIFILKIKITFVAFVFILTIVSFSFLAFTDLSTEMKHILEWNYFSFLLIYYLLSRLLWK
jgi:hypothetical protein